MGLFEAVRASPECELAINSSHEPRNVREPGEDPGALPWPLPDPRRKTCLRRTADVLLRDRLRPRTDQAGDRGVALRERPRPPQFCRGRAAPGSPALGPRRLRSPGTP